jgi:hypothetical protein
MGGAEGLQGYLARGIAGDDQVIEHQEGSQAFGPVQEDVFYLSHRPGAVGKPGVIGYIVEPRAGNMSAGLPEIGQTSDPGIQKYQDFFFSALIHGLKSWSKTALADSGEVLGFPPFPARSAILKSIENHSQKFALPLSVT